jgi:putative transcriptional regulator
MTLGERLSQLREINGLSVAKLAEKADLSRNSVYLLERDKFSPSIGTLVTLARVYQIHVADLLRPVTFEAEYERVDMIIPFSDD